MITSWSHTPKGEVNIEKLKYMNFLSLLKMTLARKFRKNNNNNKNNKQTNIFILIEKIMLYTAGHYDILQGTD